MSFSYVPFTSGATAAVTFDVGVLIALPEELNYFLDVMRERDISGLGISIHSLESFWDEEMNFIRFDIKDGERIIQVVVALVNEMGNEYTALVTKHMVERWHLPFIVNIGLTGSFDDDLRIGSVLVPSQITQYTANGKAKNNENDDGTEFIIGTRAFATSRLIVNQFNAFKSTEEYQSWQEHCASKGDSRTKIPEIHTGHLASGNMVVDSEHYKMKLKATDRKLMGCEMEAAGFAIAEQFLQTAVRVTCQFICLRCISDMAANKSEVETRDPSNESALMPREWAMRNATYLFLWLLKYRVIDAHYDSHITLIDNMKGMLTKQKNVAQRRFLQSENTSAAALLKGCTSVRIIKNLTKQQMLIILDHIKVNPCSEDVNELKQQLLELHKVKNLSTWGTSVNEGTSSDIDTTSDSHISCKKRKISKTSEPVKTVSDAISELETAIHTIQCLGSDKNISGTAFKQFQKKMHDATQVILNDGQS